MLLKNKLYIKSKWRFIEFIILLVIVVYFSYSIVNSLTLDEENFSTHIDNYSCEQDTKYKASYHHTIAIANKHYSKTLKIECSSIVGLNLDKPVDITVKGNVFLSVSQEGRELFSYRDLSADNSGDLYGLILMNFLFIGLLVYQFTVTFGANKKHTL